MRSFEALCVYALIKRSHDSSGTVGVLQTDPAHKQQPRTGRYLKRRQGQLYSTKGKIIIYNP